MFTAEILTADAAFRRVLHRLETQGYSILNIIPINGSRYLIVKGSWENGRKENLLITYKREVFFNFGKEFREFGETGVGDSINKEDLQSAGEHDVKKIYAVFPNGIAYSISFDEFLERAHRRTVKEGKEVFCITIHAYKREFEI